jgi:putative endonuclease
MRYYYVYIMASGSRVLYTGVTNDLQRRVYEHQAGRGSAFVRRYGVTRLVYYEEHNSSAQAISREKQIKGWLRAKKLALIESMNPQWLDLSMDWKGSER